MDDANSSSLSDLKDGAYAHRLAPYVRTAQSLTGVCARAALKETLEARGSLGQIKARIRAEIFAALDDEVIPRLSLLFVRGSTSPLCLPHCHTERTKAHAVERKPAY
jgi:hypothetical protein